MMGTQSYRRLRISRFLLSTVISCLAILSIAAGGELPPIGDRLDDAAPTGFGDRQNSTAWSMQWWQGKLYVGTLRSFVCWRSAVVAAAFPIAVEDNIYPPRDNDADCTDDKTDLPMQAEIWQWTPETDSWKRVYQSPLTVPVPSNPRKLIARDVGFRGMLVFTESDGSEALYVTTVSPREMYRRPNLLPPPRILRTTDGENFAPVPQTPGTFLGDLEYTGLRSGTVYEGRMFLTNGTGRGEGILVESANPAQGDDSFRLATEPDTLVWDAIAYNGYLYVGVIRDDGFAVVKTKAKGDPPYTFTPVITGGGYAAFPSRSIVSMTEFQGDLYVGTYLPAELYRIHPDDSWELVIGNARATPQGVMEPTSGMEPGFGWQYNVQIYRMQEYEDTLYVGTLDVSRDITEQIPNEELENEISWHYGSDLYRTGDGDVFEPVTLTGFDDPFQVGVRTFASTPYGLFIGTSNYWYGLRILQVQPQAAVQHVYLPSIGTSDETSAAMHAD